jgi:hypothetical protein
LIGKSAAQAGSSFDQDLVAAPSQFVNSDRKHGYSVLVLFYFLWHTDDHGTLTVELIKNSARQHRGGGPVYRKLTVDKTDGTAAEPSELSAGPQASLGEESYFSARGANKSCSPANSEFSGQ